MKSRVAYLSITLLLLSAAGCKTLLPPSQYVKWIESADHGLKQEHEVNGVQFDLQYKPADYIIACENGKHELPETFHASRKEKLGELFYFSLALKSGTQDLLMHNLNNEQEYYQRVNYYSLDFQQDIKMVVGTDTLPCLMYQFENTYGVAPYIKMSLAFSGKKRPDISQKDFTILVNDRVFGGGWLRFPFAHQDLNAIPEIKLN